MAYTREQLLQIADNARRNGDTQTMNDVFEDIYRLDHPEASAAQVNNETMAQKASAMGSVAANSIGNFAGGAASGVTKGGAAMLWPVDAAQDYIAGENTKSRHQERMQGINDFYADRFDPESTSFKLGQFGGEVIPAVANPAIAGRTIAAHGAPTLGRIIASGLSLIHI